MTTYATRLTTALGAGVDRVRRWSQGSGQEEQQQQRSALRFATVTAGDENAISDSATPPHSPTAAVLEPVLESSYSGALEDTASEESAVLIDSPAPQRPDTPVVLNDTDAETTETTESASLLSSEAPARAASSESARPTALPEDDGQRQLRQKLSDITRSNLPERERARKMHQIMTEKWNATRASKVVMQQVAADAQSPPTPTSPTLTVGMPGDPEKPNPYKLLPGDSDKTYYTGPGIVNADGEPTPTPPDVLGCAHYRRGVRLQCSTCERWHTCRFCHDEKEDHVLVRKETKNMLCMHCGRPQPAQQDCRFCGVRSAKYYCDKCKLWDDDPQKSIYHCNDCGICRIGQGLGKDFFHCKKCGVCMSIALENSHRCIERSTECDCPICGEFMFTSTLTVVFMKCGHSIHHKCYYEHMKNSYRCPTCARTILNMESQFRALDVEIEFQPLPAPYSEWRCLISCNDCSARSDVRFHFLGLKCDNCKSYNTSQVKILRPEDDSGAYGASPPQPISPGRLERMMNRPGVPMLNSPPRAASTEHGNAVEAQILSNANLAIAAADVAIQAASGLGVDSEVPVPVPVPIIDDGWETENSDDFLDDDEEEEEEEEVYAHELSEEEEDDDDDEEELINLRGHI